MRDKRHEHRRQCNLHEQIQRRPPHKRPHERQTHRPHAHRRAPHPQRNNRNKHNRGQDTLCALMQQVRTPIHARRGNATSDTQRNRHKNHPAAGSRLRDRPQQRNRRNRPRIHDRRRMQRIRRRHETRARPPGRRPGHRCGGKQRLRAHNKHRIHQRRGAEQLLDATRTTPARHQRDHRRSGSRDHRHQTHEATHLEATGNPMLHRRSLRITRITGHHEPTRPDERNQNRADRARPPLRMNPRRTRQKPRGQEEPGHRKQRRRPRKPRRRTQQKPHKEDQQRTKKRRNHTVRHSPVHRRTPQGRHPQVTAQRQRITRQRVTHPRV